MATHAIIPIHSQPIRKPLRRSATDILRWVACLIGSSVAWTSAEGWEDARPNVVIIMTDDQGYGDFGATGNSVFATPRIDQLAAESASLSTFYVCPVCSPTRAGLMTGRYNYRTRVIDTWLGRSMLEPTEFTLAEAFRSAGYATGIFGKWHLGDCYPMRALDQGFQTALVHRGGGLAQPSEPRANGNRYTDPILFANGIPRQTVGYCTDVYFDAAIAFLEEAQQEGSHFFLYLPTNAPHGPYHDVPPQLYDHYRGNPELGSLVRKAPATTPSPKELDDLARIGAMITNVDQNVGRLLDHLDRLALSRNTIVIFLVDNGPNTARYVGPFRGMKSDIHEGGIRSPCWIRWPARLPAGRIIDRMAAQIDLMPTLLAACELTAPASVQFDGRNLLPWLEDPAHPWPSRVHVVQSHRGDQPQRYHHCMIRDDRWKLLHASGFGRTHFVGEPKWELYDLMHDPGETHNLATQHPEIVTQLKQQYDRWFDDVSHTRPDNYAPPRILIGSAQENPTELTRQDWRGDHWGSDAHGEWLVEFTGSQRFEVSVEFPSAEQDGTVRLQCGHLTLTQNVSAGANACRLTLETSPVGRATIRAEIVAGDTTQDAERVTFRRTD